MLSFSSLPGEIRNKIFTLAIPQGATLAPCKTNSPIANADDVHTIQLLDEVLKNDKALPTIVFRQLVVSESNEYVYDEEKAQVYTALLQVDQKTRQETAAQFYVLNHFVFPGSHYLQSFLKRLSMTTLSFVRNVSISAFIIIAPIEPHPRLPPGARGLPIKVLWSWWRCLGKCDNLQRLNVSLEATSCDCQNHLFDQFEQHGREAFGLHPTINVAFTSCQTCTDPEKSQHWRWSSESGSQEWQVIHFIGRTQVQSLSQILEANPTSSDLALKASSIDKIKEIGRILKQGRRCETCQRNPGGMPDDLRLSRAFWCQHCELVFYCWAHMTSGRAHGFCVRRPVAETLAQRQARWTRTKKLKELATPFDARTYGDLREELRQRMEGFSMLRYRTQ